MLALYRKAIRVTIWLAVFAACAAVFVWGLTYSSSYQHCVATQHARQTNQTEQSAFANVGVLIRCEAVPLDNHAGAFTAIGTFMIAVFTLTLWVVTGSGLQLARDEFNATHRPRIRIKHVWLINRVLDDEPLQIKVLIVNVGDTRALLNHGGIVVRVLASDIQILPPDLEADFPLELAGQKPIGLGVTVPLIIGTNRIVSHAEAIEIRQGTKRLYCIGHIEYFDLNEPPRVRRTNFCRVLEGAARQRRPDTDFYRFRPLDPKDPDYEYED